MRPVPQFEAWCFMEYSKLRHRLSVFCSKYLPLLLRRTVEEILKTKEDRVCAPRVRMSLPVHCYTSPYHDRALQIIRVKPMSHMHYHASSIAGISSHNMKTMISRVAAGVPEVTITRYHDPSDKYSDYSASPRQYGYTSVRPCPPCQQRSLVVIPSRLISVSDNSPSVVSIIT